MIKFWLAKMAAEFIGLLIVWAVVIIIALFITWRKGKERMNESEVLRSAIYTFGASHQMKKAVEEMAELTKEIMKDLDGKGNMEHIAEELADVEITLAQLKLIYNNTALVDQYRQKKLRYLNNLIFEETYV